MDGSGYVAILMFTNFGEGMGDVAILISPNYGYPGKRLCDYSFIYLLGPGEDWAILISLHDGDPKGNGCENI